MASLRLTTSMNGTTGLVAGEGDLTRGTAPALRDAVGAHIAAGVTAVVIDLRQVTPEPVGAADALGEIAASAAKAGIKVQLCAGDDVRESLATGKTLALFTAIDEAVAAAGSLDDVLNECADATPVNAHDAEATWITTDEGEGGVEAS